jgi:hypothetical protein
MNDDAAIPPRLKVVTGHAPLARFMAECSDEPVRETPRVRAIPSPYAFSPVHPVWSWKGREVIIVETRHLRHEVFDATTLPTAPAERNP